MRLALNLGYGAPCSASPTSAAQDLDAAGTWLALSFQAQGKTLSSVRVWLSQVAGTVPAADITCHLQAATISAGDSYPSNTTIESRPLSAAPTVGWNEFTGFSTALTLGTQYWLVFKNGNATPASNFVELTTINTGLSLYAAEDSYGWMRRLTTDGGTGWGASTPCAAHLIAYSDGAKDGTPWRGVFTSGTTDGIYSTRMTGTLFTAPANVKLRVRGLSILMVGSTGTPTGKVILRLYEGTTLVRSTPEFTPSINPGNTFVSGHFDTAYDLTPGVQYRAVVAETTQSDTSSNRYNVRFNLWDQAGGVARMPFGMDTKRTMFDGTDWSEVEDTVNGSWVPLSLMLEPGNEFATAAIPIGLDLSEYQL